MFSESHVDVGAISSIDGTSIKPTELKPVGQNIESEARVETLRP